MEHVSMTVSGSSHQTAKECLIAILRSALTESPLPEAIKSGLSEETLAALYRLSDAHDLAHIVSGCLASAGLLGTGEIAERFRRKAFLSILRAEKMTYVYGELCDALDRAGIPYIPLKGAILREYYPQRSMRTSSDIDVFLRVQDLSAAETVFIRTLSYQRTGTYFSEISYMTPGGVHVELHFYDDRDTSDDFTVFDGVWDRCIPTGKGSQCALRDEDLLLYHLKHMFKHFRNGGCGIRPFMDLWIMENRMSFSRHCADEKLKAHGLLAFAETACVLIDAWFGDGEHTALSRSMADYLMDGGVYGSEENAVSASKAAGRSRFGILVRRIFLPYKQMCHVFPSLRRVPFLYPFYHIVRWLRCLFRPNGFRKVTRAVRIDLAPDDLRDERISALFRELGLDETPTASDPPSDPSTGHQ